MSSLFAKDLANFPVDLSGVLHRLFHQLNPFLPLRRHFELAQQVGRLHDGFDGVAQVVNQFTQLCDDFDGQFGRVGHNGFVGARRGLRRLPRLYLVKAGLCLTAWSSPVE